MDNCLFCKIVAGEIPSARVYEDDRVIAFNDIEPQAPVHILIVPKKHYDSVVDATAGEQGLLEHMCAVACELAENKGITKNGFRMVINTGKDGGQSVPHLHMHLLGARELGWPPG